MFYRSKIMDMQDSTTKNQLEKVFNLICKTVNRMNDFIEIVDTDFNFVFITENCVNYFGETAEEIIGKNMFDIYQSHDEKNHLLPQAIKYGTSFYNQYKLDTAVNGKKLIFITDVFPIKDTDDNIIGAAAINRDIESTQLLINKVIDIQGMLYFGYKNAKDRVAHYNFDDIIYNSEIMNGLVVWAKKVAASLSPVLILGETGTGKELFAQSIHNSSSRAKNKFIAINCSAVPENLLESIFFGTEKGAYTGAQQSKGLFEEANNGTIFLDEINCMSLSLQSKLLRVLQENFIRPLGSNRDIPVNARIISAMNADPFKAIENGILRKDLFFRLGVVTLEVPPLRQRIDDIPLLCNFFIKGYNEKLGRKVKGFNVETMHTLKYYDWPGNIRELLHVVEHAVNMVDEETEYLEMTHLPTYPQNRFIKAMPTYNMPLSVSDLRESLKEYEIKLISYALQQNSFNISKAAKQINTTRQSLFYRMKILGINIDKIEA